METIPRLDVRPITASVGAIIDGVDLGRPLVAETAEQIRAVLVDRGVVFFQDQDITVEQFWAFLGNFGQPLLDETAGTHEDKASDVSTSNFAPVRHTTAVWHSDTTSLARPPMASALRAVRVPPVGGDTCWSSMYAAYEGLSEPMKRMLGGLTAVHSIQPTYDRMKDYAPVFQARYDPRHPAEQVHPVVVVHPESGRKALYVNESFTTRIVELSLAESAAVLSVLFRQVESPRFTMRWKWSPNDVAFWDNRAVQHFAVPDYESERLMQRVMLEGERPGT